MISVRKSTGSVFCEWKMIINSGATKIAWSFASKKAGKNNSVGPNRNFLNGLKKKSVNRKRKQRPLRRKQNKKRIRFFSFCKILLKKDFYVGRLVIKSA